MAMSRSSMGIRISRSGEIKKKPIKAVTKVKKASGKASGLESFQRPRRGKRAKRILK